MSLALYPFRSIPSLSVACFRECFFLLIMNEFGSLSIQVYSIPISGMLQRMPFCTGGSGSTYIYGYVDSQFKHKQTKEDSLQFVSKGRDGLFSENVTMGK